MPFRCRPAGDIVEFEQGGSARAEYGARLLQNLAAEFGRGFDASNLRYIRMDDAFT
jgi:hypothetical protein